MNIKYIFKQVILLLSVIATFFTPLLSFDALAESSSTNAATQVDSSSASKQPTPNIWGEERVISAKNVLRSKGRASWDDGFAKLKASREQILAEVNRLSLQAEGNPTSYFIDSDEVGFTYEMMLPIASPPSSAISLGKDFDTILSPSGKAFIFAYEGAYDDVDSAYEAIFAWMDEKNLVSSEHFTEEYKNFTEVSSNKTMKIEISIFIQDGTIKKTNKTPINADDKQ